MEQVNKVGKPIGKNHLAKIVPIRISAEDWGQIKKETDRMSIGVSTLARIWVMESLQKLTKQNGSGNNKTLQ